MKISVELNVSDKEFYDVMMKSLQEELNHVSKKKLELKEGLKYKKNQPKEKGLDPKLQYKLKDWFQMNYMWQPLIQPLIIQRFHIRLRL